MSTWEGYVENLLATNKLNHAAIVGLSDGKVYASSPGFSISLHPGSIVGENGETKEFIVDEYHIILDVLSKNGIVPNPPGIWINNTRYHLLQFRDDINAAYLKCKNGGATVVKTNKLIIIGTWSKEKDPKRNGGNCNDVIEEIAEKFVKANY